jgi:hypothetical protein
MAAPDVVNRRTGHKWESRRNELLYVGCTLRLQDFNVHKLFCRRGLRRMIKLKIELAEAFALPCEKRTWPNVRVARRTAAVGLSRSRMFFASNSPLDNVRRRLFAVDRNLGVWQRFVKKYD